MKASRLLTIFVITGMSTVLLTGCDSFRATPYENALNNPNQRFRPCDNPPANNYQIPDDCMLPKNTP